MIVLCSIVKDEERAIVATLESVRGVVDRMCVLDTGSADSTPDVVQRAGAELYRHPFDDYASSRNRAMDRAATGDPVWVLSLSADETIHGGENLKKFLDEYQGGETAFLIEVRTPMGAFDYPRVLRAPGPWRYEGEVHEMPVHQEDRQQVPRSQIGGCWIEYKPSDPIRFRARLRDRDVPLLTRKITTATEAADRARSILLMAQTREQIAGTLDSDVAGASQEMFSALGWYALLSMDQKAPAEARRVAAWRYLNCAEMVGIYLSHEMVPRLTWLQREDPTNPALAYMLARHTANIGEDGRVNGDPRAGMQAAQKAAKLARDAVVDPMHPHDPHGLLWRPHFIAAVCARALGHGPAAKKSAEAGLAGGGPKEMFEQFLK